MLKKILLILFTYTSLLNYSFADVVSKIEVNGNKRLARESIILFSELKVNENYDSTNLNLAVKKLDKTNFFKKINLKIEDNILYIDVVENPIIEDLSIIGVKNKGFTTKLYDFMELKSRKSFREYIYLNDLTLIKNIIKKNGYYFAKIKTSIKTNKEQNSVRLIYDIDLGDRAKISKITFIGDKKIKDRKLMNVIASEEAKFWKFISNKVYLDENRLDLDKRLLTNYYKNKGYYQSKIENSFVESQNDSSFKLIYNIDAGDKFFFNNLELNLPSDFDEKYFISINGLLNKLKGKSYSLDNVEKILNEVDKIALSKQYEFVNATLSEKIVNGNKLDFIISLSETEKFYVEKINISGNSITLEEVLRNSFIVDEGDPYNEILFNKSINKIKSRKLFSKVDVKLNEGSNKNLKIIEIEVEEQPTGEISLGAGLGTSGASIGGGVKENNFLGKGITVDTNLSVSDKTIAGKLTYVKPNFNYSDNDLFTSIQSTTTDNLSISGYKTNDIGFSLGTRFEQYENLFFRPELAVNIEKLETTSTASSTVKKMEGNYTDLYFNYSLDYDLRDRYYQPTEGSQSTIFQSIPLNSETYELTNGFEINKYQTFAGNMVGKLSVYGRAVTSMTGEDVRLSKRLFLPATKLRGFESGKVGPKDNGGFIGGNYISSVNLSTTLPQILPSFQMADFNLFFDAANIWGIDYDSAIDQSNNIRSSFGIAMDLLSPLGPISFSLAQPIEKKSSDITETFRFNIGTTF